MDKQADTGPALRRRKDTRSDSEEVFEAMEKSILLRAFAV